MKSPSYIQRNHWLWQQIGIFALFITLSVFGMWHVGRLGFHFEDLSIPFDGGYRIFSGQRPYVDFVAPIGPILFLQQSLFFALFGVGLKAFLFHAALLNGVAAGLVWNFFQRQHVVFGWIGGCITLCWFYLPAGAPYIDTTAFFWVLCGFMVFDRFRRKGTLSLLVLAGFCAGLAFLAKQNIGGLAIAGLALLVVLQQEPWNRPWVRQKWLHTGKQLLLFGLGSALPLGLLAGYAALNGGWDLFLTYFWQVPLESGRLKYILPWAGRMLVKVISPDSVNSTFAFMLGPALRELLIYGLCTTLTTLWWREKDPERRFGFSVAVFFMLLQQWSFNTSNNDEALYWPFLGVLVTLPFTLVEPPKPRDFRSWIPLGAAALIAMASGFLLSTRRVVHSLPTAQLTYTMQHPRLDGLRMDPTTGAELDAVLRYIDQEIPAEESLFILGYPTLIYGLSGHPAPQPLLWFRAGVTYLADHPATSDDLMVRTLLKNKVRWVLLDEVGQEELLQDFPGVARLLEGRFRPALRLDQHVILQRSDRRAER